MPRIKGQTIKPKSEKELAEAKTKRRSSFKSIAAKRTDKAVNALASLSKCANKRSYEFDATDIAKLKDVLKEAWEDCITSFEAALKEGSSRRKQSISFD